MHCACVLARAGAEAQQLLTPGSLSLQRIVVMALNAWLHRACVVLTWAGTKAQQLLP